MRGPPRGDEVPGGAIFGRRHLPVGIAVGDLLELARRRVRLEDRDMAVTVGIIFGERPVHQPGIAFEQFDRLGIDQPIVRRGGIRHGRAGACSGDLEKRQQEQGGHGA